MKFTVFINAFCPVRLILDPMVERICEGTINVLALDLLALQKTEEQPAPLSRWVSWTAYSNSLLVEANFLFSGHVQSSIIARRNCHVVH